MVSNHAGLRQASLLLLLLMMMVIPLVVLLMLVLWWFLLLLLSRMMLKMSMGGPVTTSLPGTLLHPAAASTSPAGVR
jgi:hypothetical protein